MASKNNPNRGQTAQPDRVLIKRVRKAHMFCRTEFKDGKQTQTWHRERPSV